MSQYSLKLAKGKINELIDNKNRLYRVPNFCINLPYIEREILPKNIFHNNNKLKIILYDVYDNKKFKIELTDDLKISEIKKLFSESNNLKMDSLKIRFLYAGTELIDDNYLYQYKILDGYLIQMVKINR